MKKGHHDPMDCCVILLEEWLSRNRRVSPKRWFKSIEVLKEIKCLRSATEKLTKELAEVGVFVENE